ncbi:XK-related protein 6-like [Oppia nitens]|uniref:XK-related protein 6-like n=1 Tax=Oppia nitens TaxID=1686743 RepID=UPI0023DA1A47|nr:XK-related protein 6-like [Oppia nitens]
MVLQLYLLNKSQHNFNISKEYVQMSAIITSLLSMSWSLAQYNRALRRVSNDKLNMSRMATIVQFLWRFCTIGSRVLAVALFISEYSYWVCPVAIGHWGIMTIWVMHQQTRFCDSERGDPRPCFEYMFNMMIGAIYLFCFINVKDEPTRYKYLSFYIIVFSENLSFIILWYIRSDPIKWYHMSALVTVLGAFGCGILLMLIYYWFFHPNGRPLWINRAARCC